MTPVRLEPAALRSRVKHSTTEPLHFHVYESTKCSKGSRECLEVGVHPALLKSAYPIKSLRNMPDLYMRAAKVLPSVQREEYTQTPSIVRTRNVPDLCMLAAKVLASVSSSKGSCECCEQQRFLRVLRATKVLASV